MCTKELPPFQLSNVVNLSLIVLNQFREQECKCTQTDLQKAKYTISLYGKKKTMREIKLPRKFRDHQAYQESLSWSLTSHLQNLSGTNLTSP